MPSLLELTERIHKGELVDPQLLEVYQDSPNAAEKFLANHAGAMLDLRRSYTHLLEALEAIDYADQKVLFQFLSVLGFLGLTEQRTRPMLRFAAAAVTRREIGLALEAFQSSVVADMANDGPFCREQETATFVAQQYERAAAAIGWYPPGPCEWNNLQLRVGYVTSGLADDDASSRLAAALARHLDTKQFKLHVYSTEAAVRREKQVFTQGPFAGPSAKKGRETIDLLTRRKAQLWFAPLDTDLATAAKDLATQAFKDQIDVLIIDASPADPAAAIVACWKPAKAKLHVARRTAIHSGAFDTVAFFEAARLGQELAHWQHADIPAHLLPDGVEPITPANDSTGPQRAAYGIPDSAIVLATVLSDTDNALLPAFADTLINLLRQHPTAVLLTAGDADTTPIKRKLEAAGLAKRAGFTGRRRDLPEFLKMADIYVTPFGRPAAFGTLAAMAAGKPVVSLPGDAGDPQSPAAMIGDEHVSPDIAAYAERADRLIRDPQLRTRTGDAMRQAVAERFPAERTVRVLEAMCRALASDTPAMPPAMAA